MTNAMQRFQAACSQKCINWGIRHQVIVKPRSTHPKRRKTRALRISVLGFGKIRDYVRIVALPLRSNWVVITLKIDDFPQLCRPSAWGESSSEAA